MVLSNEYVMDMVIEYVGVLKCNSVWCTDKCAHAILDNNEALMMRRIRRAQNIYSGLITASKTILEQVIRIKSSQGYVYKPNEIGHRVGDQEQVTYDYESRDSIWNRRRHKSSHDHSL